MYNIPDMKRFLSFVPGLLLLGLFQVALAGNLEDETLFDISPQSLDSALLEFSEQAGIQLVVAANSLEGLETLGVSGQVTAKNALNTLLKNTGLSFKVVGSTVTVTNNQSDEANESGKAQPTSEKNLLTQASENPGTAKAETKLSSDEVQEVGFVIEEVLVSARKRDEGLQDVPISLSVFSGDDIKAFALDNLQDIGQFTPNLTFFNNPTRGRSGYTLYIRGVGQSDTMIQNDPGVGLYVDGVYIARMKGINMDLIDLDRVEILRGPQGTLFGKNTIGGAINMISTKPTNEATGKIDLTTGSFNRYDAKASLNIPITEDKLAIRLSALSSNRNGFGQRLDFNTGAVSDRTGDEGSLAGRALIQWTPSESIDVLLSLDGTRVRESAQVEKIVAFNDTPLVGLLNRFFDPPFGNIFLTNGDFSSYANEKNFNNVDSWGSSLTIEWNLGNWTIKSISAYRDLETLFGNDPDGTPHTVVNVEELVTQNQFSQELQFNGSLLAGRLDLVSGLYYFQESAFLNNVSNIFPVLRAIGIDASSELSIWSDVNSYALFGHSSYQLTDRLSLTAGLRYTYEEKDVARTQKRLGGFVYIPFQQRKADWSDVSFRFGLENQWTDDVMTYVSVSRGFKSGGINARTPTSAGFVPFDPEYLLAYETGIRSEWMDNRFRANASVFYSDYKDIQFTVLRGDPQTGASIAIVDNAGKARVKGFELDLTAALTPDFVLKAAVGYADAKYTEVDPTAPITTDTKFLNTPKWSATLSAEYYMTLGAVGELVANVGYSYKSKIYHDTQNSPELTQNAYGLLNASLNLNSNKNWILSLFGTNLTDERYIYGGAQFLRSLGFASNNVAAPRQWGVSLRYNW